MYEKLQNSYKMDLIMKLFSRLVRVGLRNLECDDRKLKTATKWTLLAIFQTLNELSASTLEDKSLKACNSITYRGNLPAEEDYVI